MAGQIAPPVASAPPKHRVADCRARRHRDHARGHAPLAARCGLEWSFATLRKDERKAWGHAPARSFFLRSERVWGQCDFARGQWPRIVWRALSFAVGDVRVLSQPL